MKILKTSLVIAIMFFLGYLMSNLTSNQIKEDFSKGDVWVGAGYLASKKGLSAEQGALIGVVGVGHAALQGAVWGSVFGGPAGAAAGAIAGL